MSARRYPFPFIGAGLANYFEYCSIYLRFEKVPDNNVIDKIKNSLPPPLEIGADDVHGHILAVTTEQFVNVQLQKLYDKKNALRSPMEEGDGTPVSYEAFEKDIERWLKDVHRLCPIEVAFRRPDEDIGGTTFSDWHQASVSEIGELFKKWAHESPDDYDDDELEYFRLIMLWVSEYSNVDVKEFMKRFYVRDHVFDLLTAKNVNGLHELLSRGIALERSFDRISQGVVRYIKTKNYDDEMIVHAVRLLIGSPHFLHYMVFHNFDNNHLVLIAILERHDSPLFERVKQVFLEDKTNDLGPFIQQMYIYAHNILQPHRRWDIMIPLYEFFMDVIIQNNAKIFDLSFYCNTLWVLQNDNTGLPVNEMLNEKFLTVCLPYGERNPAVFYNAACLYNEMGQFEIAADCILRAIESGIKDHELAFMISDVSTNALFKNMREVPALQPLLEKWSKR